MLGTIIAGGVGLGFAASQHDFVTMFVLGPRRLELLYYLAASCGIVLGALAILWDDLLGTREFLAQRPVTSDAMARSPLQACVVVLLSWMVIVPIFAWCMTAFWSGMYDLSYGAGFPEILATMMVAWPACAIGCVAAAMPAPWWLRLLLASTLTLSTALLISGVAATDGVSSHLGFAFACIAVAAVLFAIAGFFNKQRQDPDRPWPVPTRIVGGVVLVLAFGHSLTALGREALSNAVNTAQWEYPQIVRLDDKVGLAVRTKNWRNWVECDADHAVIGEPRPRADFVEIDYRAQRMRDVLEAEEPRFRDHFRDRVSLANRSDLYMHQDGRVWVRDRRRHQLHVTGVGPQHEKLPKGMELGYVDDVGKDPNQRSVIAEGADSGRLLRFDETAGHFVDLTLPDGDRFESVGYVREREAKPNVGEVSPLAFLFVHDDSISFIRGKNDSYAMKDGELVAFEPPVREKATVATSVRGEVIGKDPLSFVVEVPAHDGLASFRHEFQPRTATERFYAGLGMTFSVIRPPLTQASCSLLCDDETAPGVFVDRLIAGGKRVWLLLLGFAVAGVGAWGIQRRLLRIGASDHARRFWVVASALVGPIAVLLAVLVETPRRHARPNVVPAPAPRIVSVSECEEVVA